MLVTAEWPGTVREIAVTVGDTVNEDDELLTLESMKMLTPVASPSRGRVVEIHVAIDDVIEEGALLVTLE